MDRKIKKFFSVFLAVLIGAGAIFFALGYFKFSVNTDTVSTSWIDALSIIPRATSSVALSASQGITSNSSLATTTADIVARELLANYALVQSGDLSSTVLSDASAFDIAQTAINKIDLPRAKQYSIEDVLFSSDNSPVSMKEYMQTVGKFVGVFTVSQTTNDISVAFVKPGVNDRKRISDITLNIEHYDKLIRGLLSIKVPSLLKEAHLHLVQKYANLQSDILPMSEIYTDPLKALAALANYRAEVSGFTSLANEFNIYLLKN